MDGRWHFDVAPYVWISIGAGWRHMDIDYDNGRQGIELRQFNLAYDGPRVWFAYSW